MITYKLPNIASYVFSITTVTTLQDAIRTASGDATYELPQDADAIDIFMDNNYVRVTFDGNVPTAALGHLIPTSTFRCFRGQKLSNMRIVSTGGTALMSIMIGRSVPGLVDA